MTTVLPSTILGPNDLHGLSVNIVQLPNGKLLELGYVQDSHTVSASAVEFWRATATSISNVTGQTMLGPAPANIGSVPIIDLLQVGDNPLPYIFLGDGGLDESPWYGGQIRVLVANADGRYVDQTSQLPQQLAFNHRLSTGTINGHAAVAVNMIGNLVGNPRGVDLLIANPDGTFSDWSSHLPPAIAAMGGPGVYTASAIADFSGHGGDIFLGSDQGLTYNTLLVNDGTGHFTATKIGIPKPAFADGGGAVVVYALPTKLAGDSFEDLIVGYADSTYEGGNPPNPGANGSYLQFLQGDGKGGFTDVTALHMPSQPIVSTAFGMNSWVQKIEQVNTNGLNDLILYASGGTAYVMLNDGHDVYSMSPARLPTNLNAVTWGENEGVLGFYGLSTESRWIFVPASTMYLSPDGSGIDAPLAGRIHLHGPNATGAATLGQTFDVPISLTLHTRYDPGATYTFHVFVNGNEIGSAAVAQTFGFTFLGGNYTTDQQFTFTATQLGKINSLQVTGPANVGLYLPAAKVGNTDLGAGINNWTVFQGATTSDTLDASAWNAALAANAGLGSAAKPIQVTGGGGETTAFVLGRHDQYSETGIGTSTVRLSEASGLNQNAVLTGVAYVTFQDDTVLDTRTGAWLSSIVTATVAQIPDVPLYTSTIDVADTGENLSAGFDALRSQVRAGMLGTITPTNDTPVAISVSRLSSDAAVLQAISGTNTISVSDTALNVAAGIDQLQVLAATGRLASIVLTDNSKPTLHVTSDQVIVDSGALGLITTDHTLSVVQVARTVSIAPLSAARPEGSTGVTAFTFTVTLSKAAVETQTVGWSVAGAGGDPASAADFAGAVLPSGVLTLAPGESSKVLTVNVAGDTTVEANEGLVVTLSNPSAGLTLGAASAAGTIQNDDSVPVTVAAHDDAYIVREGQTLTIAAATGVLFNDQSASNASLLANASHGALQLAGTGAFTYTPASSFTGIDSFTYHAVPGGNGVDGKAVLYVVPVNTGTSTTLDLLALDAEEQIAATYVAFFGRAADAGGHAFWVGEFNRGLPVQGGAALFANIASAFGVSDEAKALYPFLVNPFGASDAQISAFLDSVYNNLFNRSSDAAGLAYWTGQTKATLAAGQFVGSILVNIMSGAQDTADGKDITTLMGKVAVSLDYVHEQQAHNTVWAGASDTTAATNLLRIVTADPLTVLTGIKSAETLIAAHA